MLTMLEYCNFICEGAEQDKITAEREAEIKKYTAQQAMEACEEALDEIMTTHKDKLRVFFKNKVGWISFRWGEEGKAPPKSINTHEEMVKWIEADKTHIPFHGGYGIAHILAKRDWEGKHIKEFLGQTGKDVVKRLPNALVMGKKDYYEGRVCIRQGDVIIFLEKDKKIRPVNNKSENQEYWIVTGFVKKKEDYQFVFENIGETVGVGLSNNYILETYPSIASLQAESFSKGGVIARDSILSGTTHLIPTGNCYKVGANFQKLVFETAGEAVGVGLSKFYIPDAYPPIASHQAESFSDELVARDIILSSSTHSLPTVYRQEKGAADQKLDDGYIDVKDDFVKKKGPWNWF